MLCYFKELSIINMGPSILCEAERLPNVTGLDEQER